MKNEITGGVSPLKKRKGKGGSKGGRGLLITGGGRRRGGSADKRAGTIPKFAGGFGLSTAMTNMAARTKNTKYRIPDKKQFPSSGGGDNTSNPPPQKPFGWTPDGGFNFDFSDMINMKINNANQQSGGGLPEEETTTTTTTSTEEKPGKSGNEFADNCYDKDGGKREGHIFYSNLKKMRILCKWGGKSDGSFNYKTEGSSSTTTDTKTTTKKSKGGGGGSTKNVSIQS